MIGINLAPISPAYNGISEFRYIDDMCKMVRFIHKPIIFIPHDYLKYSSKGKVKYVGDIYPIKKVNELFNYEIGTPGDVERCDLIISFRMHLAIRAVCRGIRTIYLGYYNKRYCFPEVSHFIYLDYGDNVVYQILAAYELLRDRPIGTFELTSEENINAIKRALL